MCYNVSMRRKCQGVPSLFSAVLIVCAAAAEPLPLVPYPARLSESEGSSRAGVAVVRDTSLGAEAYALSVTPERITITCAAEAGEFYARQTLAQLRNDDGSYPCVEIADAPAFPWRGVLLDESRHFFGKDVVKRILDRMAAFKLNVFHWHLVDSHGWRLPLDRHPELTARGAVRPKPDWDHHVRDDGFGREYGPFAYTRDEIREIVAYAAARHIRIVPEVEIPGHSRAVILCHPSFSCLSLDRFMDMIRSWDKLDQAGALCLGNDEVIRFLEDVLDEVCELFPGDTVHIGGDECPRGNWKACPRCQARKKANGLKTEDELQSWATRHFVAYLAAKGKKAIGWDEILQGGLAPGAQVMSWRGTEGGLAAAGAGHEVVMCPHRRCYLDYPTGEADDVCPYPRFAETSFLPLESVYAFDPFDGIPDHQRKFILGTQSLNWTESTWCEKDLEFKMWPRTCANAEIAWTGPRVRSFPDFKLRLRRVAARLKASGVNVAMRAVASRGAWEDVLPAPKIVQYTAGEVDAGVLDRVTVRTAAVKAAPAAVADEAYRLVVARSGVSVEAASERGVRAAKTTLAQLKALARGGRVLTANVVDWPDLAWRGFMPDTARNYLDLDSLKAVVDMMGAYKLNLLHWHLSENYAWRLESKRHPQLQSERAFIIRHPGKFYTQAEFREMVDYCWARGITVMPELDVPGHAQAFRNAFGFETMSDPKVAQTIADLFDELCDLAPAEKMPFVHVGGDEVWNRALEGATPKALKLWAETLARRGRTLVHWNPGEAFPRSGPHVSMMWGGGKIEKGGPPVFDANAMYIETLDPFELLPRAAFNRVCKWPELEPERKWGAIFCAWHDGYVGLPYSNMLRNQQILPACVMFGQAYWNGCLSPRPDLLSRMPRPTDRDFAAVVDFERRVLAQRDVVLAGLDRPFHFLRQSDMRWRLTDADGTILAKDVACASISPFKSAHSQQNYVTNGTGCVTMETWIRSPKTQRVGAWIGFTNYDRDHGLLRGQPLPRRGEWTRFGSKVELNGEEIPPPEWKRPGLTTGRILKVFPAWRSGLKELDEEPFGDQEYFMREPTPITLKEGWNHVKLTLPMAAPVRGWSSHQWIGTFIPLLGTTDRPREVPGLEYASDPR